MFNNNLRLFIFSIFMISSMWGFGQKAYIKAHKGLTGNTGFRGNIFSDDTTKPVIRDFYIIQFKTLNACTVVVDSMYIVLTSDKQMRLCPTFLDCKSEMRISAGETISVRAEKKDDDIVVETNSPNMGTYKGKLFATVNGEPVELTVQRFENIFED